MQTSKQIAISSVLVLSLSVINLSGCALFQNMAQTSLQDPWKTVETVIGVVNTAIEIGRVIFNQLSPLLTDGDRRDTQDKFDAAVLIIVQAQTTARNAVRIWEDTAGSEEPDLGKVVGDIIIAAQGLEELIDAVRSFGASVPTRRALMNDPAYATFKDQMEHVRSLGLRAKAL